MRKGEYDMVSSGADVYVLSDDFKSPRRCGGQVEISPFFPLTRFVVG